MRTVAPASVASSAVPAASARRARCSQPRRGRAADAERARCAGQAEHRGAGRDSDVGTLDHGRERRVIAADERGRDRGERLVALLRPQRLQKHSQQAVATDAEAEYLVGGVAQIVRHRGRTVRREHRARALC